MLNPKVFQTIGIIVVSLRFFDRHLAYDVSKIKDDTCQKMGTRIITWNFCFFWFVLPEHLLGLVGKSTHYSGIGGPETK